MVVYAPASAAAAPGDPASAEADVAGLPPAPGERAVEARLLAPCCWNQTLDVHESDVARSLRLEIRRRLYAGEAPERVEQEIVNRYGDEIRATSPRDRLSALLLALLVGAVLVGVGLLRLLRRWQRNAPHPTKPEGAAPRDADDERLDEELRALD